MNQSHRQNSLVFHIPFFTTTIQSNIVIARKRSLAQGNVFTRVCHSVHGECLPSMYYRSYDQGGLYLGVGQIPPGDTWPMGYYGIWSTSGRYAIYWNTFLFTTRSRNMCPCGFQLRYLVFFGFQFGFFDYRINFLSFLIYC